MLLNDKAFVCHAHDCSVVNLTLHLLPRPKIYSAKFHNFISLCSVIYYLYIRPDFTAFLYILEVPLKMDYLDFPCINKVKI